MLVLESVLVFSLVTEADVAVPEDVPLIGEELNVVAVETVELNVLLAGTAVLVTVATGFVELEVVVEVVVGLVVNVVVDVVGVVVVGVFVSVVVNAVVGVVGVVVGVVVVVVVVVGGFTCAPDSLS